MVPTARPFPSVDGLPSREPSKDRGPTENKSELATAVTGVAHTLQVLFLPSPVEPGWPWCVAAFPGVIGTSGSSPRGN